MNLILNDTPLVVESDAGQRALTAAHGAETRVKYGRRIPATTTLAFASDVVASFVNTPLGMPNPWGLLS